LIGAAIQALPVRRKWLLADQYPMNQGASSCRMRFSIRFMSVSPWNRA
jgi:hypothetical protein